MLACLETQMVLFSSSTQPNNPNPKRPQSISRPKGPGLYEKFKSIFSLFADTSDATPQISNHLENELSVKSLDKSPEKSLDKSLDKIVSEKAIHPFNPQVLTDSAFATGTGSIPGVKHVIAIASGKGGVGKSTVAANLALAFASHKDLRCGLFDADVWGPSIPSLLQISERPQIGPRSLKENLSLKEFSSISNPHIAIQPVKAHNLKVMSIGLFSNADSDASHMVVDPFDPILWRGPMVTSAIKQFLFEVDWSPLDILIVDLPPGTGDAQLGLLQSIQLSGSVIVSTPQNLALIDTKKGVNLFKKANIPLLAVVENMSTIECPNCHSTSRLFQTEIHSDDFPDIPIISLPFDRSFFQVGDELPAVLSNPTNPVNNPYFQLVSLIRKHLDL